MITWDMWFQQIWTRINSIERIREFILSDYQRIKLGMLLSDTACFIAGITNWRSWEIMPAIENFARSAMRR